MSVRRRQLTGIVAIVALLASFAPRVASAQESKPAAAAAANAAATKPHNFARWEKEISAYEEKDKTAPPAKGGLVFTGSSTIRGWKTLAQDYPEHNVINRGFGGSQIVDATHFVDRIVTNYEPKMVFLRAGGNDINAGKKAETVFKDFQDFVAAVHAKLPETDVVFIGLSPAPVRWKERDENKKLNDLVQAWAKTTPHVKYIETYDMTVNADGTPREELFVKDRLHFNPEGYKLLIERVRPFLPPKDAAK